jgi:serine/threonine protein phosphatase PrpC
MLRIDFFGKSDIGLKRFSNEDAFAIESEKGLFVLADGMGGEAAGEVASQIFIDTVLEIFSKREIHSKQETLKLVQEAFRLANEKIWSHAERNPKHQGMGCTAELLAFDNQNFVLGHVGDSRTYLLRQGHLRQLTHDHSLIQDQINQGLITPLEAKTHSLRHVILRAVGVNETLAVDLIRGRSLTGDLFLLCSDGLTDMVDDALIQETLSLSANVVQKAEKLIDLAKSEGGVDNITVILCEILSS